jgi:hypothetical protein
VEGLATSEIKEETSKAQPSEKKDGDSIPGLIGTLSGNSLGRAALCRDQWVQLDINHHRTEPRERKERPIKKSQAQPQEKLKWRSACRLFVMNSLREGGMWHVDPLLGNDCEISNYTTAAAK